MADEPNGDYHLELALVRISQAEDSAVGKTEREAKYREAITALQDAITVKPTLYKAHYQIGYLHEKLDEPKERELIGRFIDNVEKA